MKNINYILFIFLTVMFTACKDSNSKNRAAIDTPNVSPSSHREISLPKGWTISVISPQYKTVQEVVTYEPPVDLVAIPAKFKWVDGEIEGFTVHHPLPPVIMKPPIYETVTETLVVQKAYTTVSIKPETLNTDGSIIENLKVIEEHVPAVTKQVSRRVIKTPAEPFGPAEYAKRIEQMKTPHLIENGRTRILLKPGQTIKREIPKMTQTVSRRVRVENESFILIDEKGKAREYIKSFDELMVFYKTHFAE